MNRLVGNDTERASYQDDKKSSDVQSQPSVEIISPATGGRVGVISYIRRIVAHGGGVAVNMLKKRISKFICGCVSYGLADENLRGPKENRGGSAAGDNGDDLVWSRYFPERYRHPRGPQKKNATDFGSDESDQMSGRADEIISTVEKRTFTLIIILLIVVLKMVSPDQNFMYFSWQLRSSQVKQTRNIIKSLPTQQKQFPCYDKWSA